MFVNPGIRPHIRPAVIADVEVLKYQATFKEHESEVIITFLAPAERYVDTVTWKDFTGLSPIRLPVFSVFLFLFFTERDCLTLHSTYS